MKRLLPLGFLLTSLLFIPQLVTAQTADITPYAPDGVERLLLVSPDGTKVVAAKDLQAQTLCVYSVPSGDEISCADLQPQRIRINITDLAWSPDSSTVVFAERPLVLFVDGDIWTMDAATGELTNVTDDNYEGELPIIEEQTNDQPVFADVTPRFSPDGKSIAFSRTTIVAPGMDAPSELWVLDLTTGESRMVAQVSTQEPGVLYFNLAWSPDATTVYVSLFHADQSDPENGIWAVDVASGDRAQIAGATDDFNGAAPAVTAVSPLATALTVYYPAVLGQFGAEIQSGFGLLELESGEITPIEAPASLGTDTVPAAVLAPGFSPDGSSLLFVVRGFTNDSAALVIRDLESGDERIIPLSDSAIPTINNYGDGTVLGADGNAFVLTTINTADLVPIDDPSLLEQPETTTTRAAATPEPSAAITHEITGVYVQLYAAPTSEAPVVFVFSAGDRVEQIGEPVEVDGETWVPVRDPASGTIGYILAENLE
ncbi:hypothetical protein BH09CHL1_BH09CHL1_04880 [soil metagenome]